MNNDKTMRLAALAFVALGATGHSVDESGPDPRPLRPRRPAPPRDRAEVAHPGLTAWAFGGIGRR